MSLFTLVIVQLHGNQSILYGYKIFSFHNFFYIFHKSQEALAPGFLHVPSCTDEFLTIKKFAGKPTVGVGGARGGSFFSVHRNIGPDSQ